MESKIQKSGENTVGSEQVVATSGHAWMQGQESRDSYFSRARDEALRGQRLLTKEITESSQPLLEKFLHVLRKLSFRN
ncbi:hypothetical protein [Streptomyces sp. NPDC051554]|uniref:hypothetical protein n=1 Tax=Streptomyces sp. NPDC051554 TaxID=3365656 RepID=UPI00378A2B4B